MKQEDLFGLVLAGGKSMRMGDDKAFLNYHNQAQYKNAYELLKPFCKEVFVSINQSQKIELPSIIDNPVINAKGPALGIASAFEFKQSAWMVLAVDYPLISEEEISFLIAKRNMNSIATVFANNSGFFEPGIGIYEPSFKSVILNEINHGNSSIQRALINYGAFKVTLENDFNLMNVNTLEDYEYVKSIIK